MGGISGLEVLKNVKDNDDDIDVVMITAYGSIPTAIDAIRNGAYDYLLKPFDPVELGVLIEKIIRQQAQARENLYLKEQHKDRTRFESMIGQSSPMQQVFDLIHDIAPVESTVLILGETGTGKGLAAKAIHTASPLSEGPFVVVNCGAIPEHLMETELFGHQKGAFTDASETKKGRLELAHGGTIFLDEIGEISMRMQIDLLRVLEDRVFYRVGGTQPIRVDFRVIAATNRNLEELIDQGIFREDLYYRLNVISFTMPPLRKRKEDLPLLAIHFLRRFTQETKKQIDSISREAMDEIMMYEWPGNVRELENAIERAMVISKKSRLMKGDFLLNNYLEVSTNNELSISEMEKKHILQVLEHTDWNVSLASKILEVDRTTIYSKLQSYGIKRP
jgi:DNA-binding NtrC family response regulator